MTGSVPGDECDSSARENLATDGAPHDVRVRDDNGGVGVSTSVSRRRWATVAGVGHTTRGASGESRFTERGRGRVAVRQGDRIPASFEEA